MRRIPSSGTVSRLAWYLGTSSSRRLVHRICCCCCWSVDLFDLNPVFVYEHTCPEAAITYRYAETIAAWPKFGPFHLCCLYLLCLTADQTAIHPLLHCLPASRTTTRNRLAGGISAAVRMDEWMSFISLKLECVWSRWIVFVGEVHRSLDVGTSWPVILSFVVLLQRNYSLAVV